MKTNSLFLALLKDGAQPKFAAKSFATALIEESNEADEISFEVVANFIKDCFGAINLKLPITAEDVQDHFENFIWPTSEMKGYIFLYEKTQFKQVEQFLFNLCLEIHSLTQESMYATESTTVSNLCSPIHWFMQLIAIWNKACKELKNQGSTKMFNEPVARIDFQLLRGFQILRKSFRDDFNILDSICGRLLESVLLGVLYPETHATMISGLTKVLHDDFHLFGRQLNTAVNNFYEIILSANLPKKSFHKDIYKSLYKLLETYCLNYEDFNEQTDEEQRKKSLEVSNFLISSNMLNAYYHFLAKEKNKLVLISLLEFLLLLQSKLVNLDCFLDTFVEEVLFLVLDDNEKIGQLSANFYIKVMKRRTDYETICNHCIKFYFAHNNAPDHLLVYIRRLWKYLGPTENVDIFIEGLSYTGKKSEMFRIWCANFLCAYIQYMLDDYATNRLQIKQLTLKIIEYLKPMKCIVTQSYLLDIFNVLDKIDIPNKETDLKEAFLTFEICTEEKFVSFEDWQYPLQKKWFQLFKKTVKYSENAERVQEVAVSVAEHCTDVINEMEARIEVLNAAEAQKYSCALQKLCIVSQSNFYDLKSDVEILNILRKNLVTQTKPSESSVFRKHADKFQIFIDVYAIELYVIGLIQSFDVQDREKRALLTERIKELEIYLKNWLQNTEHFTNHPVVRIKTYFNCLVALYIAFGSSPKNCILPLTTQTYFLLVRTLERVLFNKTDRSQSFKGYGEYTEVNPLRSLSYKRLMIKHFSELHSSTYIEINNHYIWKICLHYNLPTSANFTMDIHDLLLNLAQKKFNIYKRVIPIVIYNLYTQQPPLKEISIVKAIKAHKLFIDNLDIADRGLFNCHVVFEVIEIVKTALKVRTSSSNRLAPLKHLHMFWNNLNLNPEIMEILKQEISALRRSSLRSVERETLTDFMDNFKQPTVEERLSTTH